MQTIKRITFLILLIGNTVLLTNADTKNERWQELKQTSIVRILDSVYEVIYSDDILSIQKPKCMKLFTKKGLHVTVNDVGQTFLFDYINKRIQNSPNYVCKSDMMFTWANDLSLTVINQTTLYVKKYVSMQDTSIGSKTYQTKPTTRKVLTAIGDKKTKTAFAIFQNEGASNGMGKLYAYSFRSATNNQIVPHHLDLFGDKVLAIDVDLTTGDIALAIDNVGYWRLVVLKYDDSNVESVVSFVEDVDRMNPMLHQIRSQMMNRFGNTEEVELTTVNIKNRAKAMLDYYIGHARRCEKMWNVMTRGVESSSIIDKKSEMDQAMKSISDILAHLEDLFRKQNTICT